MIFNSLITQIVMAAVALGIIFTYVQPTFLKIGTAQSAIRQYEIESQKVDEVNIKLQTLVAKVNNMSERDKNALAIFMPDTIDQVAVSRDIYILSKRSGSYLKSIKYQGIKAATVIVDPKIKLPVKHDFTASVSGTYDQIKNFLTSLEKNNYPLEVHGFKLSSTDTGLIEVNLSIITYSRL